MIDILLTTSTWVVTISLASLIAVINFTSGRFILKKGKEEDWAYDIFLQKATSSVAVSLLDVFLINMLLKVVT